MWDEASFFQHGTRNETNSFCKTMAACTATETFFWAIVGVALLVLIVLGVRQMTGTMSGGCGDPDPTLAQYNVRRQQLRFPKPGSGVSLSETVAAVETETEKTVFGEVQVSTKDKDKIARLVNRRGETMQVLSDSGTSYKEGLQGRRSLYTQLQDQMGQRPQKLTGEYTVGISERYLDAVKRH